MAGAMEPTQHLQLRVSSVGQVVDGHGVGQPSAVLRVDVPVTRGIVYLSQGVVFYILRHIQI